MVKQIYTTLLQNQKHNQPTNNPKHQQNYSVMPPSQLKHQPATAQRNTK